jgi:hypothetical protein
MKQINSEISSQKRRSKSWEASFGAYIAGVMAVAAIREILLAVNLHELGL